MSKEAQMQGGVPGTRQRPWPDPGTHRPVAKPRARPGGVRTEAQLAYANEHRKRKRQRRQARGSAQAFGIRNHVTPGS